MKVLIVDDNIDFCSTIADIVTDFGYKSDTIYNPEEAMRYLDKYNQEIAILLLDIEFGLGVQLNGLDVLAYCRKKYPTLPVVMISGKGSIETAVNATKLGAVNFIEKSLVTKEKIKNVLESSISNNDSKINKDLLWFLSQNGIIGKSKEIIELGDKIIKFGRTDLNILITGETGTGKKLVANAIHNISKRAKQEIVTVDIPNIPRELFQSELFGHLKGAFSGATETKKGLFQQANKGTLFLDEIGDLSSELQANLLIPIESKVVRKVGSVEREPVDIRIVSATDKDLLAAMRDNKFREQLYHRLRECEIAIPPLRERKEDIPEILNYYLKLHNEKYTELKSFSPSSYDFLIEQTWNGNVRELAGVVKVVLQTTTNNIVDVRDLIKVMKTTSNSVIVGSQVNLGLNEKELISDDTNFNYTKPSSNSNNSIDNSLNNKQNNSNSEDNSDRTLKEDLAEVDKKKIENTLIKCKGNVSKAAANLGVSRETLHNKIRKYGININDFRLRSQK